MSLNNEALSESVFDEFTVLLLSFDMDATQAR